MKYIHIVTIVLLGVLTGCVESPYETQPKNVSGNRASSKFITRIENCDIFELSIEHVSSYLYLAKCSDVKHADVNLSYGKNNSGHSRTSTVVEGQLIPEQLTAQSVNIEFSTDEKKVLDAADKIHRKYEILDKLSEEDKAVLGFTTFRE